MKLTNGYILILFFATLTFTRLLGYASNDLLKSSESIAIDSALKHYHDLAWEVNGTNPLLAQSYIDSVISLSDQPEILAQVLEIKGGLHLANANFKEASLCYYKSTTLYNQTPEFRFRSGFTQIELGTIFYKLEQYEEALKYYKSAIPKFNSADSLNKGYGKSLAHNNIGLCQMRLNDYSGALESFKKGLEWRIPVNQSELIAHSYGYFAKAYISLNQLDKADSVINMGLQLPNFSEDHLRYQELLLKKALLRIIQGKSQEGRGILENVRTHPSPHRELQSELYHSLSQLEWSEGRYNLANQYSEKGYNGELESNNYNGAIGFANLSKAIALEQNNPEQALFYAQRVSNLKDSLIALNINILPDLLSINNQAEQTQLEVNALQDTTDQYSSVIKDQKDLLIASVTLIALLLLVAYIVIRLNNKLKENQKNQRELNLRILAVINRTESKIISLGADGVIRVINKPAVNFFKNWINVELKAGDLMEEKLLGTKAFSSWRNAFAKSKSVSHWKEVSQFNIKKQQFYFLENFSSITHRDGTYAGLVMVSNDITKEHEYNIKMSEQNKTLEKSNKAKERMLSILAHDLKDAVYSAHSLSELVLETPDEFPKEELIHLFSLLHGNFDKTKSLLDGLLDWIRTQTGGLDIDPTPFKLSTLVNEVFEACYPKSIAKKITLGMDVPKDLAVSGDREMIKTVLRNLINNSIKYTQPESGCVKVIAKQDEDMVSICVKDNGQGISAENQKKLFQGPGKFTTVGTAKEQGTGFGLSLCKELINLHKSEISINSKEGEGCEFYFNLPIAHKNDLSKKQVH